jgi:hypothetical protein
MTSKEYFHGLLNFVPFGIRKKTGERDVFVNSLLIGC